MTAVAPESAASAEAGRRVKAGPLVLTLPVAVGMLVLFAAPVVVFAAYSFLTPGRFSVSGPATLGNYRDATSSELNHILARNSALIGFLAASVTLALALPIAYWLRYAAGRLRLLVLFLITGTLFASYLVRIYAWRSILGDTGLLNSTLERLGVIDEPVGFLLYNKFSVTVALVHIFLPYVVLVLFAGFGPMSPALLESAQDLGANAFTRWRRVVLPLIAAPAATAFMFVFVVAASDYVTPQLIGGTNGVMLGVQIQSSFKSSGNFPLGAATAFLMLLAFVVLFGLTMLGLRIARLDRIRWTT